MIDLKQNLVERIHKVKFWWGRGWAADLGGNGDSALLSEAPEAAQYRARPWNHQEQLTGSQGGPFMAKTYYDTASLMNHVRNANSTALSTYTGPSYSSSVWYFVVRSADINGNLFLIRQVDKCPARVTNKSIRESSATQTSRSILCAGSEFCLMESELKIISSAKSVRSGNPCDKKNRSLCERNPLG